MTKEQLRNSIRIIVSADKYSKLTDRLKDEIKGMKRLSKIALSDLHREVYRKVME